MSKIKINSYLKNSEGIHKFKGFGIKNKNVFIYKDDKTQTKIEISDIITIERKSDYKILLRFKEGIYTEGIYKTNYGNYKINIFTKKIYNDDFKLFIVYSLKTDKVIDTFEYNFEYTIDS